MKNSIECYYLLYILRYIIEFKRFLKYLIMKTINGLGSRHCLSPFHGSRLVIHVPVA